MKRQTEQEQFAAYIGIDWATQTHYLSLCEADSRTVERSQLDHKPEVLGQWVNELQRRYPGHASQWRWNNRGVHWFMH